MFTPIIRIIHGTNANLFPWKSIWCVKAPKRVSFFVQTRTRSKILFFFLINRTWSKILTYDNLIKKGFSLVG